MKKTFVFAATLILLIVQLAFASKIGRLPEVLKPELIRIYGNELFVIEGSSIFIFNLNDLTLKKKFGKTGEGPGELKIVPNFSNNVLIFPDYIFVESVDKLAYFSRDGEFIKEKRKSPRISKVMPVGENFVGKNLFQTEEGKLYTAISIYDSGMGKKKELYRQKFPQQGMTDIDAIPDALNFWVYDDKVFIEESPKGFLIEVFDKEGKPLYTIKKAFEKIKVTEKHKKETFEALKEDPLAKLQGWENIKNTFKFHFFDSFPPIRDIFVSNKKVYIQTFNKKSDQDEFVIMNLKGNILKKVYLPSGQRPGVVVQVLGLGPKFYSFDGNKCYYLKENEDDEEWELYVLTIDS